MADNYSNVFVR